MQVIQNSKASIEFMQSEKVKKNQFIFFKLTIFKKYSFLQAQKLKHEDFSEAKELKNMEILLHEQKTFFSLQAKRTQLNVFLS